MRNMDFEEMKDQKLLDIVQLSRNKYSLNELKIITDILDNRGYRTELKKQAYQRFSELSTNFLINLVETKSESYPELENQTIELILKERGFEIEDVDPNEGIIDTNPANENISYFPIVVSILLLLLNFYLAGGIYNFETTGKENVASLYLKDIGVVHDLVIRFFILWILFHYRQKTDSNSNILWYLLGIILGAWGLLIFGIYKLISTSKKDETDE